ERRGAGFKTTGFEQNIYATADSWSAPVAAEVGPDGGIYIADWYNSIVQHNVYGDKQKKGKGNAYLTEHRDRKHGRIYRIVPKGGKIQSYPKLDTLENMLAALSHPDLFWRLTAQRLIDTNYNSKAISKLIPLAKQDTVAGAHALHLLACAKSKELEGICLNHLTAKTPALQLAAIRYLSPAQNNALMLVERLPSLSPDSRHAALLAIARTPKSDAILATLGQIKGHLQTDKHLMPALTVALASHGAPPQSASEKTRNFTLSASAKRGAEVYKTATCIACHQAHGEGLEKTFPPLNKSEWLSRNHEDAIRIVLKGLNGPIKVRGKDYNGGMPAQENLTDQQIADVLNYARNSWDNKLGDITVAEVTRIRSELKDRKEPFTAKDFASSKPIKPLHSYMFNEGLQDTIGHAHAHISGGSRPAKIDAAGVNLTANAGERSTQIKNDQYIDLPNNLISNAAKQGVIGEVTIETWLQVSENRPWAWAWGFGSSDKGEGFSNGAGRADYLALIPMNAKNKKLRLCARGGGKEYYFDAKATLAPNKLHHIVVTYSRTEMVMFLNGQKVGQHRLPEKLNLTTFKNDNNWLGRSQFPDPVFDGSYQALRIYGGKLSPEAVLRLYKVGR
ncbi:MAG: LamG-like jellyroll fold domain-containing protein, partial [Akkermansiaceae bacterium]